MKLAGYHGYLHHKKFFLELLLEQKADVNAADKVLALNNLHTSTPCFSSEQSL
jgi:hypothetical protein